MSSPHEQSQSPEPRSPNKSEYIHDPYSGKTKHRSPNSSAASNSIVPSQPPASPFSGQSSSSPGTNKYNSNHNDDHQQHQGFTHHHDGNNNSSNVFYPGGFASSYSNDYQQNQQLVHYHQQLQQHQPPTHTPKLRPNKAPAFSDQQPPKYLSLDSTAMTTANRSLQTSQVEFDEAGNNNNTASSASYNHSQSINTNRSQSYPVTPQNQKTFGSRRSSPFLSDSNNIIIPFADIQKDNLHRCLSSFPGITFYPYPPANFRFTDDNNNQDDNNNNNNNNNSNYSGSVFDMSPLHTDPPKLLKECTRQELRHLESHCVVIGGGLPLQMRLETICFLCQNVAGCIVENISYPRVPGVPTDCSVTENSSGNICARQVQVLCKSEAQKWQVVASLHRRVMIDLKGVYVAETDEGIQNLLRYETVLGHKDIGKNERFQNRPYKTVTVNLVTKKRKPDGKSSLFEGGYHPTCRKTSCQTCPIIKQCSAFNNNNNNQQHQGRATSSYLSLAHEWYANNNHLNQSLMVDHSGKQVYYERIKKSPGKTDDIFLNPWVSDEAVRRTQENVSGLLSMHCSTEDHFVQLDGEAAARTDGCCNGNMNVLFFPGQQQSYRQFPSSPSPSPPSTPLVRPPSATQYTYTPNQYNNNNNYQQQQRQQSPPTPCTPVVMMNTSQNRSHYQTTVADNHTPSPYQQQQQSSLPCYNHHQKSQSPRSRPSTSQSDMINNHHYQSATNLESSVSMNSNINLMNRSFRIQHTAVATPKFNKINSVVSFFDEEGRDQDAGEDTTSGAEQSPSQTAQETEKPIAQTPKKANRNFIDAFLGGKETTKSGTSPHAPAHLGSVNQQNVPSSVYTTKNAQHKGAFTKTQNCQNNNNTSVG